MAINDFIPSVWSETLYRELGRRYVGAANSNREFEGEIRGCGDTVRICGIDPVTIFTYTKNTDFQAGAETLSSNTRSLVIDQLKGFNFQIDDVDAAQQSPKLMQHAMSRAAEGLADAADRYIFGLYSSVHADNTLTKSGMQTGDVVDVLLDLRERLYNNDVSDSEVVLEVTPAVATKLLKSKILNQSDNTEPLGAGYIGSFIGFNIYVSNNVAKAAVTESGTSVTYHKCFARTRRAVAFAEQLTSVEAYRPEKRFADAVKGLHLYGAKLVYPKELVLLNVSLAADE